MVTGSAIEDDFRHEELISHQFFESIRDSFGDHSEIFKDTIAVLDQSARYRKRINELRGHTRWLEAQMGRSANLEVLLSQRVNAAEAECLRLRGRTFWQRLCALFARK